MSRLWIDVEDLFRYAEDGHRRPSGIQRVAFEVAAALHAAHGDRICCVRHYGKASAVPVPWDAVASLYARLTQPLAPPRPAEPPRTRPRLAGLPAALRLPLGRMERGLRETAAGAACAARALPGVLRARRSAVRGPAFDGATRPGDTLLILGSPWLRADYHAFAAALRERLGLRVAMLVHDLIPIRRPEWCQPGMVAVFGPWMARMLEVCDQVLANSRFTAADVERHAAEQGLALRAPVRPVPMGSRFSSPDGGGAPRPLPAPGTYVLAVGTLEVRKNHALLVRVWRRLLEQMPPGRVPQLVFAGGIGWLVGDLLRQLDTARWLDGRISLIRDPGDSELAALYRGCVFSVFPSLWEGWGLPVTESLAFGTPCLTADATALPEAGAGLARRFDPEDVGGATAAIRGLLDDPEDLALWRQRVGVEFRAVAWSQTARAIAAALGLEATP